MLENSVVSSFIIQNECDSLETTIQVYAMYITDFLKEIKESILRVAK